MNDFDDCGSLFRSSSILGGSSSRNGQCSPIELRTIVGPLMGLITLKGDDRSRHSRNIVAIENLHNDFHFSVLVGEFDS